MLPPRPAPHLDEAGLRRGGRPAAGLAAGGAGPAAVAAVAAVATLGAASPARAETAPAPEACTSTLEGHVVDESTHEPIVAALVSVDDRLLGETDAAGRFTIRGLCPGPRVLQVERPDYTTARRELALGASASLELALAAAGEERIVIEEKAPAPTDPRSTTTLSGAALERTRGRAFSDALAEVPGVAQLRSASGMAKPIIRGQFGRRLLILVDSVRHRAQEWGLDHAPEIDPFVADELTVVRGASGVRYGPDAIGGAILVEPPPLPTAPGTTGEAHLVGATNGAGAIAAGRVQTAPAAAPGLALQLEGSLRRLAAASTPDYALDNTGSGEWSAGAVAGYRRRGAAYTLSYRRYQARLGVCSCLRIDSIDDFYAQLASERPVDVDQYDADLEIERPYQAVAHDLAVARATRTLDRLGKLTASYAFQHDRRREYDIVRGAVSGPQFDFRLMTHELGVSLEHERVHLSDHLHLHGSAGVVGLAELHSYRGLPLVPDYRAGSAGIYAIERLVGRRTELEAGVRYDVLARRASIERRDFLRLVRSGQLAMDACGGGGGDPVRCSSVFHTLSASLGVIRWLTPAWSAKLDLSTASRPPNPDEQYLNGSAPTFPVLGLGKPDLGPETTYGASATTSYRGARATAEVSIYANRIDDYIYFAPAIGEDGQPIFDVLIRGTFPRFATRAVDAVFYGADGGAVIAPGGGLELGAQVSLVRARNVTDDTYLVLVPADRARGSLAYRRDSLGALGASFAQVSATYVARQRRFDLSADLAPPPGAYVQLGAELGTEARIGGQLVQLALQGSNLTGARSRDYTSLLRYFADQPGRQVLLRLSVRFSSPTPPRSKGT